MPIAIKRKSQTAAFSVCLEGPVKIYSKKRSPKIKKQKEKVVLLSNLKKLITNTYNPSIPKITKSDCICINTISAITAKKIAVSIPDLFCLRKEDA